MCWRRRQQLMRLVAQKVLRVARLQMELHLLPRKAERRQPQHPLSGTNRATTALHAHGCARFRAQAHDLGPKGPSGGGEALFTRLLDQTVNAGRPSDACAPARAHPRDARCAADHISENEPPWIAIELL